MCTDFFSSQCIWRHHIGNMLMVVRKKIISSTTVVWAWFEAGWGWTNQPTAWYPLNLAYLSTKLDVRRSMVFFFKKGYKQLRTRVRSKPRQLGPIAIGGMVEWCPAMHSLWPGMAAQPPTRQKRQTSRSHQESGSSVASATMGGGGWARLHGRNHRWTGLLMKRVARPLLLTHGGWAHSCGRSHRPVSLLKRRPACLWLVLCIGGRVSWFIWQKSHVSQYPGL